MVEMAIEIKTDCLRSGINETERFYQQFLSSIFESIFDSEVLSVCILSKEVFLYIY